MTSGLVFSPGVVLHEVAIIRVTSNSGSHTDCPRIVFIALCNPDPDPQHGRMEGKYGIIKRDLARHERIVPREGESLSS